MPRFFGSKDPTEKKRLLDSPVKHYGDPTETRPAVGEDKKSYKSRWRSIRVMYLTMFLSSVTFSITMTSIWPFLHILDSSSSTDFLGWVVAAYSVGQLIASPMFGFWANVRKKSRDPLAVSLVIELLSNIMYTYMESFPSYTKYYLILARGLIGFGAGNVAVVRSYVSGATTVKERTGAMANVSIFQTVGFILGPAIQAALVPLGYPGPVDKAWFHLNMYTSPGYFGAVLCVINIVLLFAVFREHRVIDHELHSNIQDSDSSYEEVTPAYTPDYVAVISAILIFFVVLFMFTVFETIATPLSMNEFAWTKNEATLYNGIILATAGVEAIAVFIGIKQLSKRFNERFLLIGGFVLCLMGYFILLPWGNQLPIRSPAIIEIRTTGVTQVSKSYSQMPWNPSLIQQNTTTSTSAYFQHMSSESTNSLFPSNFTTSSSALTSMSSTSSISASSRSSFSIGNSITTDIGSTTSGIESTTSRPISMKRLKSASINTHSTKFRSVSSPLSTTTSSSDTSSQTTSTVTAKVHSSSVTSPLSTTTSSSDTSSQTTSRVTAQVHTSSDTSHQSTPTLTSNTPFETTSSGTDTNNVTTTVEPEGCPSTMSWCNHTPRIYLPQYLVGVLLISAGYPCTSVMTYTMYSKILGPKPQGTWMGWLTASGSLARTLGPIFVSQIYTAYGPRVTFASDCAIVLITIIGVCIVFKRLVPFSFTGKVDDTKV